MKQTINQAIEQCKTGLPVFVDRVGEVLCYLTYKKGAFYFETYLKDGTLVDEEEVDEDIARFSLIENYAQDFEPNEF
jgi:hypothetical protein